MALRSINLAVNDYCNFACAMCHIWKNGKVDHIDADAICAAFGRSASTLTQVEELSITGGEIFLRRDLLVLITGIIEHLPRLERLFLNTNGSFVEEAVATSQALSGKVGTLYVCVSIDGERAFHDRLRGTPSYDNCVNLIQRLKSLRIENLVIVISTTIVDSKNALRTLEHVRLLSNNIGTQLTFRIADNSAVYYKNGTFKTHLTATAAADISTFIDRYYPDNRFFSVLKAVMSGDRNSVMIDDYGKLVCRAGDHFAFVQADGAIRPCIYSSRIVGHISEGLRSNQINDLGAHEPCPCCTECTIYPMLEFAGG